jgi:hypothetical protein
VVLTVHSEKLENSRVLIAKYVKNGAQFAPGVVVFIAVNNGGHKTARLLSVKPAADETRLPVPSQDCQDRFRGDRAVTSPGPPSSSARQILVCSLFIT